MYIQERLKKLRSKLEAKGLDACVIYSRENRQYFSSFSGSSGAIIVTQSEAQLFTDFRYIVEARENAIHYDVIEHGSGTLDKAIGQQLKKLGANHVGIAEALSVGISESLQKEATNSQFTIVEAEIMEIRMIKDESEIAHIKEGIRICDLTFKHILTFIKPGMSEKDVGLELEYVMKKNGAGGIKENHVIASGERASLPHGQATERILKQGDLVKMDFGAKVNGYYTDFTRTVVLGEPTEKQLEIYGIVSHALETTLQAIGPGKVCSEIDEIGRSIIRDAGYGDNFGHGLGHSLGLNIHESPSFRDGDDSKLQPGMVITVEPGIYIPKWGGVRIEDLVVITEDGIDNLTTATKEFQVLNN